MALSGKNSRAKRRRTFGSLKQGVCFIRPSEGQHGILYRKTGKTSAYREGAGLPARAHGARFRSWDAVKVHACPKIVTDDLRDKPWLKPWGPGRHGRKLGKKNRAASYRRHLEIRAKFPHRPNLPK